MPGPRPHELIGNLGYIFIGLQVQAITLITNRIVLFNSMLSDVPMTHLRIIPTSIRRVAGSVFVTS